MMKIMKLQFSLLLLHKRGVVSNFEISRVYSRLLFDKTIANIVVHQWEFQAGCQF